ncbi:MAG: hypothetical protein DCC58_00970 [Chloroflexi bacterium]|nr:MAG: hypothetical protein DCC58_00970 [Chloroflexota bacterium]
MREKSWEIRRADAADLPEIVDIWYRSEVDESAESLPYPAQPPAMFRHLMATADVRVAVDAGEVIGFAVVASRGDLHNLALMFVRAERQSAGVGRALLRALLPPSSGVYCTGASNDPRAQSLYIRAGMRPRWPLYHLLGDLTTLAPLESDIRVEPADVAGARFPAWDRAASGQGRPQDLAALGTLFPAQPLLFVQDDAALGYGVVHTASDVVLAAPDAFALGPLGAVTQAASVACTLAAVRWASSQPEARLLRVALPGPHPALAALLEVGFRIVYVEQFMASAEAPFDPRRYIPFGSGLL